ncbi:zinc ABC transporter permease AztB [Nocardia flavorosea]|uniref:zinc ABC transporter permease AztB n=1 Tax=Nocardia flavorosea TaxID=53429 RepID=UPI0024580288|nr:zinc ABC transporter permease AztB [Nocardia flavorosea]
MDWLIAPFEVSFVQRALWGGLLVSCLCALAGTWVVVRGMAFLGEALAHGMLPGVAVAALLGGNLLLGALVSASAMAAGVSVLSRNRRLSTDTGIGLLFVAMLATAVILISRSQSFAVDLTGFLFGDVLATRPGDLLFLLAALVVALVITVTGHRAFVALSFDPRTAHTLGLRPRAAQVALLALLTLAIAASFHIVGTLLVLGLLVAPPAAATYFTHRIPRIMLLAAGIGALSTVVGLVVSWHAGTAAGATIALTAVMIFFLSALVARVRSALRTRPGSGGSGGHGEGGPGPVNNDAGSPASGSTRTGASEPAGNSTGTEVLTPAGAGAAGRYTAGCGSAVTGLLRYSRSDRPGVVAAGTAPAADRAPGAPASDAAVIDGLGSQGYRPAPRGPIDRRPGDSARNGSLPGRKRFRRAVTRSLGGKTLGRVALAGLLVVPVAACGSEEPAESVPHGYVEGAEESASAQPRLVIADRDSGAVRLLDVVTEEITDVEPIPGVTGIAGDGRYAYLAAGDATTVVDSGSWVVDHGDHVHYYRAQPRRVGVVDGSVRSAHSDPVVSAAVLDTGSTVPADRAALDEGELRTGPAVKGVAVPYGGHLLVVSPGSAQIEVRTREDEPVETLTPQCPDPGGYTVTRRGAVFSCGDGALLVTERDDRFTAEKLPYPAGTTGSVTDFHHRPGSDVLVAVRESLLLVLDIARRSWRPIETGPVTAATTAGAGTAILALTPDGVLHAYDPATGAETAHHPVLSAPVDPAAAPVLLVDSERAYLNDPARREVHEIDYADDLRVARTFSFDIDPDLMVETGR